MTLLIILPPFLVIALLIYIGIQNRLERNNIEKLLKEQQKENQEQRTRFDEHQIKSLKLIQESLKFALEEVQKQIVTFLNQHNEFLE